MANVNSTENPTHIGDVESYLKFCSDAFGQLEAILIAIEKQSEGFSSVRSLAGAGPYKC